MSALGMNRKAVESLVKAGACDGYGISRSRMVAVIDMCFAQESNLRRTQIEGQMTLFEACGTPENRDLADMEPAYPEIPEFGPEMRLAMEKEMLGFYLSGHPLDRFADTIRRLATVDSSALAAHPADTAEDDADDAGYVPAGQGLSDGTRVVMAGLVLGRKNKTTKKNELMCFLTMEDLVGEYEAIVFPRVLKESGTLLEADTAVLLEGTVSFRAASGAGKEESDGQLTVERVLLLDGIGPGDTILPGRSRDGRRMGRRDAGPASAVGIPPDPDEGEWIPPETESFYSPEDEIPGGDRAGEGGAAAAGSLCVRHFGTLGDPGYRRLLSMLRFFHGGCPTCVFLDATGELVRLPQEYWIECDDRVIGAIAARAGLSNIAFI